MRLPTSIALAAATALTAACSDSNMATNPTRSAPTSLRADRGGGDRTKTVKLQDECDQASFDANVAPGTCVRKGGVKFDKFIEQLTKMQHVPEWKFSPDNVNLRVGDVLAARNTGGEMHTFTEVKEFGGGVNGFLNNLAGTPVEAAECKNLSLADFIAPGGTTSEVTDEAGDEKYQCCIHPWMRATVHISSK